MFTSPAFEEFEFVSHAFFGRRGGVSNGVFDSLNCAFGTGDSDENVRENRRLIANKFDLGPEALITVSQRHTADALIVDGPFPAGDPPVADALVTDRPNLLLGVMTADCAPVLLVDPDVRVIGAAHAGWPGALAGILESTVATMQSLGAQSSRIVAVIGPGIRQPSYEVGDDFKLKFLEEDAESARFFTPGVVPDTALFDLPGYAAWRLNRAGVVHVFQTGHDTCAQSELFFSYRRATLEGDGLCGRELSAITLRP